MKQQLYTLIIKLFMKNIKKYLHYIEQWGTILYVSSILFVYLLKFVKDGVEKWKSFSS